MQRHRHRRIPRRAIAIWAAGAGAGLLIVAAVGYALLGSSRGAPVAAGPAASSAGPPSAPGPTANPGPSAGPRPSLSPTPGPPTPAATKAPAATKLLFGLGAEADSALTAPLTRQAPVHLLTSWYNGPNDLSWMTGWRTGTVPRAYAAGYALHLIVYTNDPETQLSTSYGPACGRAYPLSAGFTADMTQLARTFAGAKGGPPLYVTMFTEFQTYPCQDNAWSPDAATTHYYQALQDQYRAAYRIFHDNAANARVSIGWGGWQAGTDDPATGGGRSLFPHFADLMRGSDFQSFQAMDSHDNVADIQAMVAILGRYGPVMLAHYKPDNGSQSTFDADVHAILTGGFLGTEVGAGLFALSFMDSDDLAPAATLAFVKAAVVQYGRSW